MADEPEPPISDPTELIATFLDGATRYCCRRTQRPLCDFHEGWAGGMEWGMFIAQAFAEQAERAKEKKSA